MPGTVDARKHWNPVTSTEGKELEPKSILRVMNISSYT